MDHEHWFDRLNKALVRDAPRRTVLRAAATVVTSLALWGAPGTEAAKSRKKGKGKGKKKGKGKPKPTPSCSGGACAAEPAWTGNQAEIGFCEVICRQCDEDDPREFCIDRRRRDDPVARCCDIEQTCCGNDGCCPDEDLKYCCDLGAGRPSECLIDAMACCPDDFATGVCDRVSQRCCAGYGCEFRSRDCPNEECGNLCTRLGLTCCHGGCFDTDVDHDHCGRCDRPCNTALAPNCCDGNCVDVRTDIDHCGGCNRPCAFGAECVNGNCRCREEGQIVCDGECVDRCECAGDDGCPGDLIPDPCRGAGGSGCVTDQNYVCCAGFRCVIIGERPDNYYCCGSSPDDDPNTICKRFDEACHPDKRYPALATYCSCGDPVCEER